MTERTYSKGLLFWIDDSLEGAEIPADPWSELFADYSDRVYRLLDLQLMVATSYEDAIKKINELDLNEWVGTFIYCVVDLSLPKTTAEGVLKAKAKYGIAVAEELHKRGYSFSFLSSSVGGTSKIDESGLGAIPYYIKDEGQLWRFPTPLVLKVLSEFHRHVNWISMEWIEEDRVIHPHTTTIDYHEAMVYYPFFGSYRNFVERCEYRDYFDIDRPVVIRSAPKHSDEFVFQSLMVYFYPLYIRRPNAIKFLYGYAHDQKFINGIQNITISSMDTDIPIIRILPEKTKVEELSKIIETEKNRRMVIILPDDETIDPYIEKLREYNINAVEELPKIRVGDIYQQEELIKRSCVLIFQDWYSRQSNLGDSVLLHKGSFTHPQLIINPINWTVLLETENVPTELSDPYEILLELLAITNKMGNEQARSIRDLLQYGKPIPYEYLLRVGQETLSKSEFYSGYKTWVESTLDIWLKTSHQFPYGIYNYSTRSQFVHNEVKQKQILKHVDSWQDSCYDILVNLMKEYRKHDGFMGKISKTVKRLKITDQFINVLGQEKLLSENLDYINWEELEQLRWPHRFYPLPSAIFRRIREAGKYLWIQPEGLDLALAFPYGRRRYRVLGSMVDRYWRTLNWLSLAIPNLPKGWRENIEYLTNIILEHRVQSAWEEEQDKIWQAFLCLVSNGAPILFIANTLLAQKPISDGKGSAIEYLTNIQGYGKLLGYLRGYQQERIGKWIVPSFDELALEDDLEKIKVSQTCISNFLQNSVDSESKLKEIRNAFRILIDSFSKIGDGNQPPIRDTDLQQITDLMLNFLSNEELCLHENSGWYIDNLNKIYPGNFNHGISSSLLGTKLDYIWLLLDTVSAMNNITRQYRYYDGYHFLSVIYDIRLTVKYDTKPNIPLPMIETALELFIGSIEGIIAQMAWLVELSGNQEISKKIMPSFIKIHPPEGFSPPDEDVLSELLQVKLSNRGWELGLLGKPGTKTTKVYGYHTGEAFKKMEVN